MRGVARGFARGAAALLLALALACGGDDDAAEGPPPDLVADVEALQQAMTEDLELLAMEEVEEALARDLPVRAAQLIGAGALPAARAHAERLRETSVQTARGRRLRDEGAQLLDARADALATYQTVLERGLVEDLALLESIQEQRQAEEAIGAYLDRLAALRPLAVEEDDEGEAPRRRRRSRDTPRSGGDGPRPATR